MSKDNGGPAFPAPEAARARFGAGNEDMFSGVTVRDYFAGNALGTIPAYAADDAGTWGPEDFARHAYLIADAMLLERDK